MKEINASLPWFRYRIVWLVLAIPTLTVLGCMLTIYLAITSPDEVVSDFLPTTTETR